MRTRSEAELRAVLGELERADVHCEPSGVLAHAWRTADRADLARLACFARGLVEVQDLGSQLILAIAGPSAGGRWLDACAGAGGKALQLAELLGPEGCVDAEDPRGQALGELSARARRAGTAVIHTRIVASNPAGWSPKGSYEGVLVDAPCSGTGTWRRHPHLRLCTSPGEVARMAALQLALLRTRSAAVRPGGVLVYATCSLCRTENEAVVEAFLGERPEFADETPSEIFGLRRAAGPGLVIAPWVHDTDGFYVCVLRKRAG